MRKSSSILNFIGVSTLLFVFCIVAIFSTILYFGGSCHRGIFFASLIIALMTTVILFLKELSKTEIIASILVFSLILALSLFFCGEIYTYDYDGNAYHKLAVGLFKNGWNPIKETGLEFSSNYFGSSLAKPLCVWIEHYGKAAWLFSSAVYAVTNNIECGKAYQLLGCISLFCISCAYLLKKKTIGQACFFAFLLAFNPVSLSQLISYYVDGFLFSLLYILIIALFQLFDNSVTDKRTCWVMVFSSMLVLSNVKFTGLLYGGIICILAFGGMLVRAHANKRASFRNKSLQRAFAAFAVLAILCVCWIGYPTYVTNYIDHQTFTYPLTGEGKIDIVTGNSPAGFAGKSQMYQFFYGIFAQMENLAYDMANPLPKLKVPFAIYTSEVYKPCIDLRVGGFGVFFSGILLISLVGICHYLFNLNNDKTERIIVGFCTAFLLGISIAIPSGWWARYNPFLWLIPVVFLFTFASKSRIKRCLYYIFCIVVLANTLHFLISPGRVIQISNTLNPDISEGTKIITDLNQGIFVGVLFNFEDNGIEYEVVDALSEADGNLYCVSFAYEN